MRVLAIVAGLAAITALALGVHAVRVVRDPVGPVPPLGFEALRAQADYETSRACRDCHPEHVRSWARTYHRTMTQEAGPESVVAPFDGRALSMLGVTSVPRRDGAGFVIDTLSPASGKVEPLPVVMTVGSRRIQQYVARFGEKHVRLPLAWSVDEDRWFHLSESFFHPDGEGFSANASLWDVNCIFCHNVKAQPGALPDGSVDSRVEELGIACEACHGPGEEHARRMRSPVRRAAYARGDVADPTIVTPPRLSQLRSVQVCGHCHGQRVPARLDDVFEIMRAGDPYTPGEDLFRWWRPIRRDTVADGIAFAPRFWKDGSPRLTAYEMQGVLDSPCFADERFTCLSCHAMHEGDPKGQIRPDRPGDAACVACHEELAGPAGAGHAGHEASSEGARCGGCHMPEVAYGIMTWHPSHLISLPDPARSARHDMPDACTTCHAGRSRAWAEREAARLWPGRGGAAGLPDDAEMPRALFAGDAPYRTLAAHRLGLPGPEPEAAKLAVPLLAEALLDPYPNVRRTAGLSLRALTGRTDVPGALDPVEERRAFRDSVQSVAVTPAEGWPFGAGGRIDRETIARWTSQRDEIPFSIGE